MFLTGRVQSHPPCPYQGHIECELYMECQWAKILRTAKGRKDASIIHRRGLPRGRERRHNRIIRWLPSLRHQSPQRTDRIPHFSTAVQCVALQRGHVHTHMNKCTRNHRGTAHAVSYDPFLSQSPAASRREKRFSPCRAPRNTHTPDLSVFSNCDQPNMFLITMPGPGGSG